MDQRATSGLQHHHTQGLWQNANPTGAVAIHDNHFISDLFDKGPPLTLNNNHGSNSPAHHPTNFIHSPASTRSSKSHRYMTRLTQNQELMEENIHLPPNTFRPLPFYDEICVLIRPTMMQMQKTSAVIEIKLTIDQADLVAMGKDKNHIVLRFCHVDPTNPEQDDNFPPDAQVSVNDHTIQLPPAIANPNRPNTIAKRPGQHVDITQWCKLSPFNLNKVKVQWLIDPMEPNRGYGTTIIIGERVSPLELLNRIKERGRSDPEQTKKLILGTDSDVGAMELQFTLMCPLGKSKMTTPCKSTKCNHIPCFDAFTYLQMNEKKAQWICPLCYKPAYYPDLVIDGFFAEIIEKTASDVTEVTLNLDGSWSPVLRVEQKTTTKNPPPEIICISDSDDE